MSVWGQRNEDGSVCPSGREIGKMDSQARPTLNWSTEVAGVRLRCGAEGHNAKSRTIMNHYSLSWGLGMPKAEPPRDSTLGVGKILEGKILPDQP